MSERVEKSIDETLLLMMINSHHLREAYEKMFGWNQEETEEPYLLGHFNDSNEATKIMIFRTGRDKPSDLKHSIAGYYDYYPVRSAARHISLH